MKYFWVIFRPILFHEIFSDSKTHKTGMTLADARLRLRELAQKHSQENGVVSLSRVFQISPECRPSELCKLLRFEILMKLALFIFAVFDCAIQKMVWFSTIMPN